MALDRETKKTFWTRPRLTAAIVLLGLLLRLWAATQLPLDADEPAYLQAGMDYAQALKAGNISAIINYPYNTEHPALVKLLYGVALLPFSNQSDYTVQLLAARLVSVIFGTLAVLALALIDPLAGALMAVQTLLVKYTSEAYLEALPLFASIAAIFFMLKAKKGKGGPAFWLSAIFLGMAAAGKYSYFPILLVVLYLFFFTNGSNFEPARLSTRIGVGLIPGRQWWHILVYLGVAAISFFAFDPSLWNDPLGRLAGSLFFHTEYSQSLHVLQSGYPWYQPLLWISRSQGFIWHPDVFFYFGMDGLIFWLGIIGLARAWKERSWVVFWLASSLIILLAWPTKWPQYTLVLLPALCLAASETIKLAYGWVAEQESYYSVLKDILPAPGRAVWLALALTTGALVIAYAANTVNITLGRLGWSHYTAANSFLPDNTVNDIQRGPGQQMALATDNGLALWSPAAKSDAPDIWTVLTTKNSSLPSDQVLSLAYDGSVLWCGTSAGLARFDGKVWKVYHAKDFGLAGEEVRALALVNGKVWIGTNTGAAVYDGQSWRAYTHTNSGLISDAVFSVAARQVSGEDEVWFGTLAGASQLLPGRNQWKGFTSDDSDIGAGGLARLAFDSKGRLWAASLGGGVSLWDGSAWQPFRVDNSGIPYNIANVIFEARPGWYWVGTAIPNFTGGLVASFDGTKDGQWKVYSPALTGFSGAEPLAIAVDAGGRIWIGTRTAGVDIYQAQK